MDETGTVVKILTGLGRGWAPISTLTSAPISVLLAHWCCRIIVPIPARPAAIWPPSHMLFYQALPSSSLTSFKFFSQVSPSLKICARYSILSYSFPDFSSYLLTTLSSEHIPSLYGTYGSCLSVHHLSSLPPLKSRIPWWAQTFGVYHTGYIQ